MATRLDERPRERLGARRNSWGQPQPIPSYNPQTDAYGVSRSSGASTASPRSANEGSFGHGLSDEADWRAKFKGAASSPSPFSGWKAEGPAVPVASPTSYAGAASPDQARSAAASLAPGQSTGQIKTPWGFVAASRPGGLPQGSPSIPSTAGRGAQMASAMAPPTTPGAKVGVGASAVTPQPLGPIDRATNALGDALTSPFGQKVGAAVNNAVGGTVNQTKGFWGQAGPYISGIARSALPGVSSALDLGRTAMTTPTNPVAARGIVSSEIPSASPFITPQFNLGTTPAAVAGGNAMASTKPKRKTASPLNSPKVQLGAG